MVWPCRVLPSIPPPHPTVPRCFMTTELPRTLGVGVCVCILNILSCIKFSVHWMNLGVSVTESHLSSFLLQANSGVFQSPPGVLRPQGPISSAHLGSKGQQEGEWNNLGSAAMLVCKSFVCKWFQGNSVGDPWVNHFCVLWMMQIIFGAFNPPCFVAGLKQFKKKK